MTVVIGKTRRGANRPAINHEAKRNQEEEEEEEEEKEEVCDELFLRAISNRSTRLLAVHPSRSFSVLLFVCPRKQSLD